MCSPRTMFKIGVVIAVPIAVGFIAFPQWRAGIISLAPFALFALCPLGMLFGMKMMGKDGDACRHDPAKAEAPKKAVVSTEKI